MGESDFYVKIVQPDLPWSCKATRHWNPASFVSFLQGWPNVLLLFWLHPFLSPFSSLIAVAPWFLLNGKG